MFVILHILTGIIAILMTILMILTPLILGMIYFLQYGIHKINYSFMDDIDIERIVGIVAAIEGVCFMIMAVTSCCSWIFSKY